MSSKPAGTPEENYAWAVKTGDLDGVKNFVEKEKLSVNLTDSNKRTPLHWASDFNQVEVMKYLISKGAAVNSQDAFGITPLLAATYEGHAGAVKLLLEHKADSSIKGPDGLTAKEAAEKPDVKALFK